MAGSILAILVGILHPRPSDLDDPEAFLRAAAESPTRWLLVHLGLVLASILLLAGLGAIAYALWHGPAAGLARVGLVGAAVGRQSG